MLSLITASYRITNNAFESQLAEIRDYANLLRAGITSIDQIKVYFCGQPEAGKTTLSRSLVNKRTKLSDEQNSLKLRTRGIDVMHVQMPSGAPCVFWDFAGQADYHVHHDIFMSSDASLYVVLVDARASQSEREAHATYWLQYILTQCSPTSKPNVLLLDTHIDEVDEAQFAEYSIEVHLGLLFLQLTEVFEGYVNFIRPDITPINCLVADTESIVTVRAEIEDFHAHFKESVESKAPLICKQIMEILSPLRNKRTHFLTWYQFTKTVAPVSTDQRLLKSAVRYLHTIGDLYYSSRRPLDDIIIIDLPWLCHEVLGWIFCPPDMLQAHNMAKMAAFRALAEAGPVAQKDIPIVHFFEGTQVRTVDVLEHFDLCTPVAVEEQICYLFPSLLSSDAPRDSWMADAAFGVHTGLRFVCASATHMIPPGLFSRLQIHIRHAIAELNTWQYELVDWHSGIIIKAFGVQGRAMLTEKSRSIVVHVRGSNERKRDCRRLLQLILRCIHEVAAKSPGLGLDVEHVNSGDLAKYVDEPQSIEQAAVVDARNRGRKLVVKTTGFVDTLASLLAIESERKKYQHDNH